ncbi:MAG: hypothetical protein JNM62_04170 [Flavobacteriales bacterium]|nr:hypothetical protein [Flavobacteriales bacterium]
MKRASLSRTAILLVSALSGFISCAQRYETWRHFNSNNGLPQNSVVDMELDTAGYVWIATEGGLVRYDGGALRTFELQGEGVLPAKRIRKIIPTALGEIIVEDAYGNVYTIHGHIAPRLLLAARHRTQAVGGASSVEMHLAHVRSRRLFSPNSERAPASHAVSEHEYLLIGDSLWGWRDSSLVFRRTLEHPLQQSFFLGDRAIGLTSAGEVFAIDVSTGGMRSLAVHGKPALSASGWPEIFWHDRRSEAFMALNDALFSLRLNQSGDALVITRLDVKIPPSRSITDVLSIPRVGVILIGTATTGLHVLREERLHAMGCNSYEATKGSVFAHAEVGPDELYFAAARKVFFMAPDQCREIPELVDANPFNLVKDHDGALWFLRASTILRYDTERRVLRPIVEGAKPTVALKALGDSMLISTGHEIRSWRFGREQVLAKLTTLGYQDWPSVLAVDDAGRVMYGSDRGLFIQNDLGGYDGVPGLEDTDVRTIERVEEFLFVGTYGNGWYVVKEGKALRMPNDPTGCLDYAHSFVLRQGILWISTNRGLIRTTLEDLRGYLKDPQQRPYLARFGSAAGMVNLEFNGGCEPAVVELSNGLLSYPALEGLVQFDPALIPDPFPARDLIQGRVHVDGERWSIDRYLDLDHDVEQIQFEFSLPYWGDPENAQVEYRIPGIVEGWQLISNGVRTIELIRPPPGDYVVHVRKVGSAARHIEDAPFYGFVVNRPLWATWPAILVYGAALVLLLYIGTKLNTARLRRRNKWLEENVALQTETILHANQELRRAVTHQQNLISVISHDVVPPLRFVARVAQSAEVLLREGRPGNDLGETLADLSASTQKLHSNAESLLTWIRTRSKHTEPHFRSVALHALVEQGTDRVREMIQQAGIRALNEVPPQDRIETDPDLLGIVLHNLLMNVRTHARASQLIIRGALSPNGYLLSITDNGVGIPLAILKRLEDELKGNSQLDDPERIGPATGLGFVIIAECMRQIGGRITLACASPGLRVTIHLPLSPAQQKASQNTAAV